MLATQSFSEEWKKSLDGIENNPFVDPDKATTLASLLHACEIAVGELNQKRKRRSNDLLWINRVLFSYQHQMGRAVFDLCKAGYGVPALAPARSLLECLIDFSYLWLCKEITEYKGLERKAWMDYFYMKKSRVINHWKKYKDDFEKKGEVLSYDLTELLPLEKYSITSDVYKNKYPQFKSEWTIPAHTQLDKRALEVDATGRLKGFQEGGFSLVSEYVIAYKGSSEYVHPSSSTFNSYVRTDEKGNEGIIFGPSNMLIDMAFIMAINYLLIFLRITNDINHLNYDINTQLEHTGWKIENDK